MPVYDQHHYSFEPVGARRIEFEPVSEEDIRRSYDSEYDVMKQYAYSDRDYPMEVEKSHRLDHGWDTMQDRDI